MIALPAKSIEIVKIDFTQDERKYYDFLFEGVIQKLNEMNKDGGLMKNYTHVMSLIVMLRRACNHPFLVRTAASLWRVC